MHDSAVRQLNAVLIGTPDSEIVDLEARLRAAQMGADVAAMDALVDDDLLFTGPDGSVGTKAQDLAAHASGAVRFREHQPTELRVRRVGDDVAIVALRAQLAVEVGGRVVQGDYSYTRVWARNAAGTWRVVGGQVSAVSEDTPAA